MAKPTSATSTAPPAGSNVEPEYVIQTRGQLHPWLEREWLLTNGLGGFASSSVVGCNTRRYHGLLVAATRPPVGRCVMLNRAAEILRFDGCDQPQFELSINQFGDVFHPRGDRYLRRFELGRTAWWEFEVEGVRVGKEVLLVSNRNIVGIRYRIDAGAKQRVEMQWWPFVSLRDFHALRKAGNAFAVVADGASAAVADGQLRLQMRADGATFVSRGDWWHNHTYAIETQRGQDDCEDLYTPGFFQFQMDGRHGELTIWAGSEELGDLHWDQELARRQGVAGVPAARRAGPSSGRGRPGSTGETPSPTIRRVVRAAEDFVVARRQENGSPGCTILAGYPWFSDWGRDTMIALPGLLLSTGRTAEAGQVLCTFAQHVSRGMIPNVFNDYTNQPDYNTVDASLWFVHAAHEYQRLGGEAEVFAERLLPACRAIVEGYQSGTRFHIGMDPSDGLIHAGDSETQLTWMDAKCGGIAFTPRHGKAVEINALWYNALECMGQKQLAARVRQSFVKTFWQNSFHGLLDVVDGSRRDASVRPNQIFAVSLPHSPLSREQQQSVVDVVRRELLTPMGLRTLAAGQAGYRGRYGGPQMQRDAAYHNGTVWAWLLGPFVEAYLRINDRSPAAIAQARQWLTPLIELMSQGGPCVGQISEIFEGDAPHRAVGCFAQAWSVAEVLRMAIEVGM